MVMREEHAEWEGLVWTLREGEVAETCVNRKYGPDILPPVEEREFHNMMVIWRQITDSAFSVLMLSFRLGILDQCVDSVWSWRHQAQVSLTTWLPGLPKGSEFLSRAWIIYSFYANLHYPVCWSVLLKDLHFSKSHDVHILTPRRRWIPGHGWKH
jgi:hypothetical protein